jgi:hypothetical protein
MSEQELDASQIEAKVLDLASAMERVRNRQAERDDVVVEMKQAARARLELLAQDLEPVFRDIPEGNDQFELALSDGEMPRLWIDMTAFVRLGRDRRTYEFVKDTRLGRTLYSSSDDRQAIGKQVAEYIAERVLERQRILEGDWISLRQAGAPSATMESAQPAALAQPGVAQPAAKGGLRVATILMFLLGIAIGAAGMVAWAWFYAPPLN